MEIVRRVSRHYPEEQPGFADRAPWTRIVEWVAGAIRRPEYSVHRGHDGVRAWIDVLGRVVSGPALRNSIEILEAGAISWSRSYVWRAALTATGIDLETRRPTRWYSRSGAGRSRGSMNTSTAGGPRSRRAVGVEPAPPSSRRAAAGEKLAKVKAYQARGAAPTLK